MREEFLRKFSFFSGQENEQSFKINYQVNEEEKSVKAIFVPDDHHTSYQNTVHGGLMAALLDDAMAYAINHAGDVAFTGKLEIRFKTPPQLGEELHIEARVDEKKRSLYYTLGKITSKQGQVFAEAKAVFMQAPTRN